MSELTPASIKKLKVAELRAELTKLGLDTKGTKPVLLERLLEAISGQNEENNAVEGGTEGENETDSKEESSQESQDESADSTKQEEPVVSTEPSEVVSEAKAEEEKVDEEKTDSEVVPVEKMETNHDESASATPPKETVNKSEDAVTETSKDEEKKKVDKEEPMDETAGDSTASKHAGNKNIILEFPLTFSFCRDLSNQITAPKYWKYPSTFLSTMGVPWLIRILDLKSVLFCWSC